MHVSTQLAEWLHINGRLYYESSEGGSVKLNILQSDLLENGHTLHNVLVQMAKKLGVEVEVNALGCAEDDYCSPSMRLFNWKVLQGMITPFGYTLDNDGLDLIVNGDLDMLVDLLNHLHYHLNKRSHGKGYSYQYQPTSPVYRAPLAVPEPATRSSSVPPAESTWSPTPTKSNTKTSTPIPSPKPKKRKKHKPQPRLQESFISKQCQVLDDISKKRKDRVRLQEEVEQAARERQERKEQHLKRKIDEIICAHRTGETPLSMASGLGDKVHIKPVNRSSYLICCDLVHEIVEGVVDGSGKERLLRKAQQRERARKRVAEKKADPQDKLGKAPLPVSTETLKECSNKLAVLAALEIIDSIITSVVSGEAAARLQKRQQELKKARELRHRKVLHDIERPANGVSASKAHKDKLEEERRAALQKELEKNHEIDAKRKARQEQAKQLLEQNRAERVERMRAAQKAEQQRRQKEEQNMQELKAKQAKALGAKKKEIQLFREQQEHAKLARQEREEALLQLELDKKKAQDERQKKEKERLAQWIEKQKELGKRKTVVDRARKPLSLEPRPLKKVRRPPVVVEPDDTELPVISCVCNLPSVGRGNTKGEQLLTQVELCILDLLAEGRQSPASFVDLVHDRKKHFNSMNVLSLRLNGVKTKLKTSEGLVCCEEALQHLGTQRKACPFKDYPVGLTLAARQQAADLTQHYPHKVTSHHIGSDMSSLPDRLHRYGRPEKRSSESIFVMTVPHRPHSEPTPLDSSLAAVMVADMLCGDGDPSRQSRRNIFNNTFTSVGIGHSTSVYHSREKDKWFRTEAVVVVYAQGFVDKPVKTMVNNFMHTLKHVAPSCVDVDASPIPHTARRKESPPLLVTSVYDDEAADEAVRRVLTYGNEHKPSIEEATRIIVEQPDTDDSSEEGTDVRDAQEAINIIMQGQEEPRSQRPIVEEAEEGAEEAGTAPASMQEGSDAEAEATDSAHHEVHASPEEDGGDNAHEDLPSWLPAAPPGPHFNAVSIDAQSTFECTEGSIEEHNLAARAEESMGAGVGVTDEVVVQTEVGTEAGIRAEAQHVSPEQVEADPEQAEADPEQPAREHSETTAHAETDQAEAEAEGAEHEAKARSEIDAGQAEAETEAETEQPEVEAETEAEQAEAEVEAETETETEAEAKGTEHEAEARSEIDAEQAEAEAETEAEAEQAEAEAEGAEHEAEAEAEAEGAGHEIDAEQPEAGSEVHAEGEVAQSEAKDWNMIAGNIKAGEVQLPILGTPVSEGANTDSSKPLIETLPHVSSPGKYERVDEDNGSEPGVSDETLEGEEGQVIGLY